ncbi:hypothetical protein Trydic_g8783 [Trypoxylus dichotomus]
MMADVYGVRDPNSRSPGFCAICVSSRRGQGRRWRSRGGGDSPERPGPALSAFQDRWGEIACTTCAASPSSRYLDRRRTGEHRRVGRTPLSPTSTAYSRIYYLRLPTGLAPGFRLHVVVLPSLPFHDNTRRGWWENPLPFAVEL